MSNLQEYKDLITQIRAWDTTYYKDGTSPVSDAVYDAAKMKLQAMENEQPDMVVSDSPTQVIGQVQELGTGYKKVAHRYPMLSLRTEVDTDTVPIRKFLQRVSEKAVVASFIVAEPKYDGLGLDLQYDKGSLVAAVTRGDGETGEDVTHIVNLINDIPKVISNTGKLDVRGEVLLFKSDFQHINSVREASGNKPFSNCRNAAAGLMRMKNKDELHDFLHFMAYELVEYDEVGKTKADDFHMRNLNLLSFSYGFKVKYDFVPVCFLEGKLDAAAEELHGLYLRYEVDRPLLDFEVDGVVFKLDSLAGRNVMGFTGREPNWAIAQKFVPMQVITKVIGIRLGVGKTGRVTPVAELQPVFVGGAVISNATLVHARRINELNVAIGDDVIVQRAGDVIPELIGVSKKSSNKTDTEELFSKCPCCGGPLTLKGEFYNCTAGSDCQDQILAILENAASRPLLNLQGIGGETLVKLYEKGIVKTVPELFLLTPDKLIQADVSPLLVTPTSIIVKYLNEAKKLPLWKVLASLGISNVGKTTSKELVSAMGSLTTIRKASKVDLLKLPNIGPETAESIVSSFKKQASTLDALEAIDSNWTIDKQVAGSIEICITGSIDNMAREDLKKKLEDNGYICKDSISKNVKILLAGTGGSNSKIEKASLTGIQIINSLAQLNLTV